MMGIEAEISPKAVGTYLLSMMLPSMPSILAPHRTLHEHLDNDIHEGTTGPSACSVYG